VIPSIEMPSAFETPWSAAHNDPALAEHQRLIRHLSRLQAILMEISRAVLRGSSREQIMQAACDLMVSKGEYRAACIGKAEQLDNPRTLAMLASSGDPGTVENVERLWQALKQADDGRAVSPTVRAVRESQPLFVEDTALWEDCPEWVREWYERAGVHSLALVPVGSPAWGVIGLYGQAPQPHNDDEAKILRALSDDMVFALQYIEDRLRMDRLAYTNLVTGLPNRHRFLEDLAALRRRGPLIVAQVKVVNLGDVNHSRGREAGDTLLRVFGERVSALAGDGRLVAHVAGNTFALALVSSLSDADDVNQLHSILDTLAWDPVSVAGTDIPLQLRCGFAAEDTGSAALAGLMDAAGSALREGMRRDERIHAYSSDLGRRILRRTDLVADLREALAQDQFELHYQPQFSATERALVGAEALLRWRHPVRGLVSPAEFVPLLEETGLIVPVGRWVRETAARQLMQWPGAPGGFRVSVNVAVQELREPGFVEKCAQIARVNPGLRFEIELTESSMMAGTAHNLEILKSIKALDWRIAIDDFGTGYSSLSYLAQLPVDVLKIDRSFVTRLTSQESARVLAKSVIRLAHGLSLQVVAEGVETEDQAALLQELRCDVLQGFLLGRPVTGDEFERCHLADPPT
jgi:EAL domain-containing protein (putative c-di-GMP-specific phosphodiesterase class I)/GGDEF domain-containing protein